MLKYRITSDEDYREEVIVSLDVSNSNEPGEAKWEIIDKGIWVDWEGKYSPSISLCGYVSEVLGDGDESGWIGAFGHSCIGKDCTAIDLDFFVQSLPTTLIVVGATVEILEGAEIVENYNPGIPEDAKT